MRSGVVEGELSGASSSLEGGGGAMSIAVACSATEGVIAEDQLPSLDQSSLKRV